MLSNPEVKPAAFVHFVIKTKRFDEQINFYKTFLNGRVVMRSEWAAFLTYDQEHHRIAIGYLPDLPDLDRRMVGFDHVSYAFSSLGDLLANYLRLEKSGIVPYWSINHGPTTSLYYRDIDGNQIETQADNFDTLEELHGFFNSSEFHANPVGVELDPDDLVALYRQGVPEIELKRQGIAPRKPGTEYISDI